MLSYLFYFLSVRHALAYTCQPCDWGAKACFHHCGPSTWQNGNGDVFCTKSGYSDNNGVCSALQDSSTCCPEQTSGACSTVYVHLSGGEYLSSGTRKCEGEFTFDGYSEGKPYYRASWSSSGKYLYWSGTKWLCSSTLGGTSSSMYSNDDVPYVTDAQDWYVYYEAPFNQFMLEGGLCVDPLSCDTNGCSRDSKPCNRVTCDQESLECLQSDSSPCSGHGTCGVSADNRCDCDSGYYGWQCRSGGTTTTTTTQRPTTTTTTTQRPTTTARAGDESTTTEAPDDESTTTDDENESESPPSNSCSQCRSSFASVIFGFIFTIWLSCV